MSMSNGFQSGARLRKKFNSPNPTEKQGVPDFTMADSGPAQRLNRHQSTGILKPILKPKFEKVVPISS